MKCCFCGNVFERTQREAIRRQKDPDSPMHFCSSECYHKGKVKNPDRYIKFHVGTPYVDETTIREHRIVYEQHNGSIDCQKDIHHINGIKSDNRTEISP